MPFTKKGYFQNRTFEAGQVAKTIKAIVDEYSSSPPYVTFTLSEKLHDNTISTKASLNISALENICETSKFNIHTQFGGKPSGTIIINLGGFDDYFNSQGSHLRGFDSHLELTVSCESTIALVTIFDRFRSGLSLEEIISPLEMSIRNVKALEEKITQVNVLDERATATLRRPLKCFLSYRFTSESENIALRVQRFLSLLDVEVITGGIYEPRRISEKVLSKLREPLDFIVLLITRDGESTWTRDEVGAALHTGIAIVPLVEEGVEFNSGILADLEYIQFAAGHIGDAFLKLLEAVWFIKQETKEIELSI